MTDFPSETFYYKRRLPHYYKESYPVFLTWRLKFTLPSYLLARLKEMKADFEKSTRNLSDDYKKMQDYTFHKKIFGYMDAELDRGKGMPGLLKQKPIAGIIQESLLFHDQAKYSLHAYCIMPSHVHVLLTPYADKINYAKTLSSITQTLKRHTARKINQLTGRTGSFWSEETYDHLVRNESEFSRIVSYILLNPVNANLAERWEDWEFNWVHNEFKNIMEKLMNDLTTIVADYQSATSNRLPICVALLKAPLFP